MTVDYPVYQYDSVSYSRVNLAACIPQWDQPDWSMSDLLAVKAKKNHSVAVVIPALNEALTVGKVIRSLQPLWGKLVDEIWVIDSGSSDDTVQEAVTAGAQVALREDIVPHILPRSGKGEVLWRSLGVVQSDIVTFMDADLIDPDPDFIPKLIGPLLLQDDLQLVKAYYRRPLMSADPYLQSQERQSGGGRVTELLVRPLISALRPELSQIIQPLAGEYAARFDHLRSIPFAAGYGVDIGILLDTVELHGINAIGQVNLGVRSHRNRPVHELGKMSREVTSALLRRCGIQDSGAPLVQFIEENSQFFPGEYEIILEDRPPFRELV